MSSLLNALPTCHIFLHCIPISAISAFLMKYHHQMLTHGETAPNWRWNLSGDISKSSGCTQISIRLNWWLISMLEFHWSTHFCCFIGEWPFHFIGWRQSSRLNSLHPPSDAQSLIQVAMFSKCWYSGLGFKVPAPQWSKKSSNGKKKCVTDTNRYSNGDITEKYKDMKWYESKRWMGMEINGYS